MQLSDSTVAAMQIMQDPEFTNNFTPTTDGGDILDGLTSYFSMYEVPVGLVNKLLALQFYNLNFIVDDSGSMRAPTDVSMTEATPHVLRGQHPNPNQFMTRWQEAENRLHIMMDVISFIPTKPIVIAFLNAKNVINLTRQGKSPAQFQQEAHSAISHAFSTIEVKYQTPTFTVLSAALNHFNNFPDPTMHYLLTDGVPSDHPKETIAQLVLTRSNPERSPITLISCSNEDSEVEWMKEVSLAIDSYYYVSTAVVLLPTK
jgi:hypothetical protein